MSVEELPNYENAVALARAVLGAERTSRSLPAKFRKRDRRIAILGLATLCLSTFLLANVHVDAHRASLGAALDFPGAKIHEDDEMRVLGMVMALTVAPHCSAGANLIVGGDFETVPVGSGQNYCFSTYLPTLPGWSSSLGAQVDRIRNEECEELCWSTNPMGGLYYISLQGSVCCGCDNNGWMEQTVALTPGRRYRLQFDAQLDQSDQLRVSNGAQQWIYSGTEKVEWTTFAVEFTALSKNTLRFASESPASFTPDGCGACWEAQHCSLDNISLVEIVCPGDVVANGIVDGADLAGLLSVWGTDGGIYPRADTNGDGFVDAQDLAAVLGGWGACP
jgi:hypothetical protein